MCSRVTCRRCGKATWSGCGSHVEQVMAGVPKAQRCQCPPPEPGGLFKKLFGRPPHGAPYAARSPSARGIPSGTPYP